MKTMLVGTGNGCFVKASRDGKPGDHEQGALANTRKHPPKRELQNNRLPTALQTKTPQVPRKDEMLMSGTYGLLYRCI